MTTHSFEAKARELVEQYSLGHQRDTIRAFAEALSEAFHQGQEAGREEAAKVALVWNDRFEEGDTNINHAVKTATAIRPLKKKVKR